MSCVSPYTASLVPGISGQAQVASKPSLSFSCLCSTCLSAHGENQAITAVMEQGLHFENPVLNSVFSLILTPKLKSVRWHDLQPLLPPNCKQKTLNLGWCSVRKPLAPQHEDLRLSPVFTLKRPRQWLTSLTPAPRTQMALSLSLSGQLTLLYL